jgi:hypothetical protein
MAKNYVPIKKKYKLWWDYLCYSKNYEEFCDLVISLDKERSGLDFDLFDRIESYYATKREHGDKEPLDAEYDDWWGLYSNWKFFGDVRADFEVWWRERMSASNDIVDLREPEVMKKLSLFTLKLIKLKRTENRFPNISEFMNYLCSDPSYVLVAIPTKKPMKKIYQEIKFIRDNWRREIGRDAMRDDNELKFTGRLRHDDVNRYLDIYKFRDSNPDMKWEEIILNKGKEAERDSANNENMQRKFRRYVEKAEKIVSNVEQGIFPGKYD